MVGPRIGAVRSTVTIAPGHHTIRVHNTLSRRHAEFEAAPGELRPGRLGVQRAAVDRARHLHRRDRRRGQHDRAVEGLADVVDAVAIRDEYDLPGICGLLRMHPALDVFVTPIGNARLAATPVWGLVAFALMCASMLIRAEAWHAVLRAARPNARVRRRDAARGTMIGVLMSATLPARLGSIEEILAPRDERDALQVILDRALEIQEGPHAVLVPDARMFLLCASMQK